MKYRIPIIIIILACVQLGLAASYFSRDIVDFGFKNNLSGYGLIISGVSFLILGFGLYKESKK